MSLATVLASKPPAGRGVPVVDDWRVAVEIGLASTTGAYVGSARVGSARVAANDPVWVDLTPLVRGAAWTRGSTTPYGQPDIGQLTLDLSSIDYQLSPFAGTAAWLNAAAQFACGTLVRVVAHSPTHPGRSRGGVAGFVPQFTGIVRDWADYTPGGARRAAGALVVVDELLGRMATVDNPATAAVGAGDTAQARYDRLLTAAAWQAGTAWPAGEGATPMLATTLDGNRLAELVRTADSDGVNIYTARDGRATHTPANLLTTWANEIGGYFGNDIGVTIIPDRESLDIQSNGDYLLTDVTFTNTSGSITDTVFPANPRARYGEHSAVVSDVVCNLATSGTAPVTRYRQLRGATVAHRIESFRLTGRTNPANQRWIIGADIDQPITVVVDRGRQWTATATVRAMTHTLRPGVFWDAVYQLNTSALTPA